MQSHKSTLDFANTESNAQFSESKTLKDSNESNLKANESKNFIDSSDSNKNNNESNLNPSESTATNNTMGGSIVDEKSGLQSHEQGNKTDRLLTKRVASLPDLSPQDNAQNNSQNSTQDYMQYYSPYLRVASPIASNHSGFYHTPRVGDEVLISFLDNDIDKPYISGSLYNNTNTPNLN
ncbi:phage baseplate assembly protein V, partial [Helicobacter sp. T3_23-1059]